MHRLRANGFTFLTLLVVGGFLGAFLVAPVFQTLRGGLQDSSGAWTFRYVAEVFRNPLYREGLRNSFLVAVCTTGLTLLLAVPMAWIASRFEFPGRRLLTAAVLLPMVLPPFVGALGLQRILGRYGALNSLLVRVGIVDFATAPEWFASVGFWGVCVVMALHLYPILYLNALAAFANVDPTFAEAAADLGCVGFRRFRRITLPLIMPGLFAGGVLVFIWSFTELGTPLMFGYTKVTSVQVFNGITEIGTNPFPYALVTVLLLAAGGLYALSRLGLGRFDDVMSTKAGVAERREVLTGIRAPAAAAVPAVVCLLAILPHLGVLGMAGGSAWYRTILPSDLTVRHFDGALSHALTVPSILNSLRYAGVATLVALAIGVPVAYVVVRTRVRGAAFLDALAMLPLAVPGLVLAFGYLAISREGRLLHAFDPVENPTVLLIIAYAVRRLPYVVRSAAAGFQQTARSLEEAGADLGAPPWRVFQRITLPLIAANLIAGALLAFSFAMLEVSDSLVLAQKEVFFPITKAIYELSMILGEGHSVAAALGTWAMLLLATTIAVASILLGRRLGALFRA